MSYTKNTTTGLAKVLDNNKYYAFGMNHLNQLAGSLFHPLSVPYNYKYNSKELQETGMYDYGWRHYMPDIGRWNGMDQLAEVYSPTSPYAYVINNPISFIDPDGRKIDPIEGGWKFDGSDIHFIFNYLANNGDFVDLVSQLEDYGNNFGSGPVSDFWNSFNSGDVTGVNVQNGWMSYSTPYGSNGDGMLQGFTSWNFQINQERFNGFMGENQEKAFGVFLDVTESVGGFSSSILNDRFKYGNKYGNKPITIRTKFGPGLNTTSNRMKNLAKTGKVAGKVAKGLVVADIAMSGEIKASHVLTATMIGVNAIPVVGNAISGIYFGADLLTMGVSYLTTGEANGIGDYLDQSLNGGVIINARDVGLDYDGID